MRTVRTVPVRRFDVFMSIKTVADFVFHTLGCAFGAWLFASQIGAHFFGGLSAFGTIFALLVGAVIGAMAHHPK